MKRVKTKISNIEDSGFRFVAPMFSFFSSDKCMTLDTSLIYPKLNEWFVKWGSSLLPLAALREVLKMETLKERMCVNL